MAKLIPAPGALVDMFAHYTSPITSITALTATGRESTEPISR